MLSVNPLLHASFYNNNKSIHKTPSFTGGIEKPVLERTAAAISGNGFSKFLKKFKNWFNGLFKTVKKGEVNTMDSKTTALQSKISKAERLKKLNIPENGVVIRQDYEEHYQDGNLVKKVLLPKAYQRHTLILDSTIEYKYNKDGELVQMKSYHKDLANEKEVNGTKTYINLGDLSIEEIRDL